MASERHLSITNAQLCLAMRDSRIPFTDIPQQAKNLQEFVLHQLGVKDIDIGTEVELEYKLKTFLSHVIKRYQKSSRKFDVFITSTKNASFLSNPFPTPSILLEGSEEDVEEKSEAKRQKVGPKVGRQSLSFEEKSIRGQQLASAQVRDQHDPGAITLAASQQNTPLGKLIRRTNSPSGSTARLALSAIISPTTGQKIIHKRK
jgi:hypothetical protein